MRHEENNLDLNNLPDDFSRDGNKQVFEDGSSSGYRKKKTSGKAGKDESSNIYECRFCSLKFCKSQALGGHMNRHRQERETETLNHARQLVYRNDNLAPQGVSHFGYHPAGQIGDPTLYRPIYTPRLFPGGSCTSILPPPPPPPVPSQQPPYLYPPSPSLHSTYPTHYPQPHHPMNDCYLGHVLNGNGSSTITSNTSSPNPNHQTINYMAGGGSGGIPPVESTYTCIGAPVGHGGFAALGSGRGDDDGSQPRLDASPSLRINRFQDQGF